MKNSLRLNLESTRILDRLRQRRRKLMVNPGMLSLCGAGADQQRSR